MFKFIPLICLSILAQHLHAECPAHPECKDDEMPCPTAWPNPEDPCGAPMGCVPNQVGDCWNVCPTFCGPEEMHCAAHMPEGSTCPVADFCMPKDSFCPVHCGKDDMHCPGPWDPTTGKQSGPDYCMPMQNGECWNSCPVSCGEHDQVCPGNVKDDGCQEPEFCHDKNAFCPVHCGPEEMHCPGPWEDGKQLWADHCMPMKDPATGCPNMCPVHCGEHDQICPGGKDWQGCYMGDFCSYKEDFCPVHCGPEEMHCPGPWDHATGKQSSPDFCMPMKDPATGCHNMCPVQCAEHDQVCPGSTDEAGCYTGDICHSKDAFCPTQCAPDQMHCGGHWEDGKQVVADTCVPNKDGNDCPGMCPVHCGENDQICAGGKDWNDCYMGDFCHPKDSFCPVHCGTDDLHCPGPWDHATGKQSGPDYCMAGKDGECWNACPVQCGENDQVCPGPVDDNGCKVMADFCHNMDSFCPVHCGPEELHCAKAWIDGKQSGPDYCLPMKVGECWNHCPVECDPEKDQVCPGGKDHATGCEHSGFCHPQDSFCPVHCGPEDMHCPGTWDHASGKQSSPDYCMPMKDPATGCPNMCPVQCGENDQVCPGYVDATGCQTPDTCMMKDGFCPVHCSEEEVHCPGPWVDGKQTAADFCLPKDEACPISAEPECKDLIATKKCKKRKNKGKCSKPWNQKKCAKTCGAC